jgi:peptidoglycan/xylan/chitin deacetylase (PgdA/CDA1 family)
MQKLIKHDPVELDRGVFTISLDFELIWGTLDLFGAEKFRAACEIERAVIIDRLLDLFVEYDIPATWCILGHLFLDHCESEQGIKHPEIVRPAHAWFKQDWFEHDPSGDEDSSPLFFGRSLVEKIQSCTVKQEIGCHSFSHVIFGDAGCSVETAESELAASVEAAKSLGIEMRSFAFPRNEVGHLAALRKYGFTFYRGPEPNWYEQAGLTGVLKRLAHLLEVLISAEPPVVLPEQTCEGLWNIPGSMIYFPMHGLRRHIPTSFRVRRAIKGLDAAAHQNRIFHLWFHPTNMADRTDTMFDGLRRILEYACSLRARDELIILPMCSAVSIEATRRRELAAVALPD